MDKNIVNHQVFFDQQPCAYKAKKEMRAKDHSFDVEKDDLITPVEFESLSVDQQDNFFPVFDRDEKDILEEGNFTERNLPGLTG